MAEIDQTGGELSPEIGIPSGLNRIKTRRAKDKQSSKDDDTDKLIDSRNFGVTRPPAKAANQVHRRTSRSRAGVCKGKRAAHWVTSHLFKNSSQDFSNIPQKTEVSCSEAKPHHHMERPTRVELHKEGKHSTGKQSSPERICNPKPPKGLKSYSHELGPRGGIPSLSRPRSYNDIKELLGSLYSRFDTAKGVVNAELGSFSNDVKDVLQKNDLSSAGHKTAEDLLILAQKCIEMSSSEFRVQCEKIVHGLTENRQQCQTGLLKWLFTRMLFILTRCTRLLQFEKDNDPIHMKSFHKFQRCLECIPDVVEPKFPSQDFSGKSLIEMSCSPSHEQELGVDESDSVICRICEDVVPTNNLESHSYICAYADKCDSRSPDIDERLLKLAEVLEQIIESRNTSSLVSFGSPENARIQSINSAISECYSPKISEWRNKGVEGMFEDLHEMDTACIDDSHLSNFFNLKGLLGSKLSHCGAPSSTGSVTSVSSGNTPRSSHFDLFWLEHNNASELEDLEQMDDLADIARCVAGINLSEEGSSEFLLACIQDLKDVLQHSKLKALIIDTFGGRIENLLREKYLLACDLKDLKSPKGDSKHKESSRFSLDNSSPSSTVSTPLNSSHKERTSIDDFDIIKPISKGAFGKVFLARKHATGDLFAIKVLKKLDLIRKNDIERIIAERNILIAVRNPFVVRFFYSFTCRDNLYLVMEYLNGGDLYSLLQKLGCLEEDVARSYIAELVLALEYLHSLGIVHRDLKPDNILIAHDGHIKLTDFGLSKIGLMNTTVDLTGPETCGTTSLDTDNLDTWQTRGRRRSSAVGTPDYLAPEILLGTEHGHAADWWSVGIILFELTSGIPPFCDERPEMIFDNILNQKIPWPVIPDDMSYEAQDLISRLLIHDPGQRLGAKGSSEVKEHPFFKGVNWETLALQKAAFVPHLESADDTSYFVSRYTQLSEILDDKNHNYSTSDTTDSSSNFAPEMDACRNLVDFDSSSFDLSMINFSFKNLSQLAAINYDVLLQSGKVSSKCSSPSKDQD